MSTTCCSQLSCPRCVAYGFLAIVGVGISVCDELDWKAITNGIEDKEAAQKALADAAWQAVVAEYKLLEIAIMQPDKKAELTHFTQPFLQ